MNLLQLQERPSRRTDGRKKSTPIHLLQWIGGSGAEREVVPLAAPCGKCVDDARNAAEWLGMKERYLKLALYL